MLHESQRRVVRSGIAFVVALSTSVLGVSLGSAAVVSGNNKVDKAAVLRFGLPIADQGGVTFDPSDSVPNPVAQVWMDLIYDTMIHPTADGKGAPGLASAWTTPDPQTVELTLRKGVKFSDGSAFNAAAVKAARDRLLASGLPTLPAEIRAFRSVEAVDDTTVRIRLSQPIAKQLVDDTLKNSFWLGVPSPDAARSGTLNSKPVGAGPYSLKSYDEAQKITLSKNPQFYDPKAQKLAGMELIQVPGGPPAVAALQTGVVDLIFGVAPEALDTLEAQPDIEVTSYPSTRVFDLGLCVSEGPFASKQARQALQYALDRDAINEAALSGTGTPTILPLTAVSPYYNESLQKTYSYKPKKAKSLLKQAGVAPGTTVRALVPVNPPEPAISEVVQSQLEDVGLKMEITQSSAFVSDAARLRPDIAFVFTEPALFSIAFENTGTALNVCDWTNPEATSALTTTRDASKTDSEQQAAWDSFQKLLLDESPVVYTLVSPLVAAHDDKVKGLDAGATTYTPSMANVYIVK